MPGQPFAGDELARPLGDEHLAAVRRGGDPRRAMHVDADVVASATSGSPVWRPMRTRTAAPSGQACAHERRLRVRSGCDSGRRIGESDEEAVPLRVDLDAPVVANASAGAAGGPRDVRVAVAEFVQEPGRALDVGEKESD